MEMDLESEVFILQNASDMLLLNIYITSDGDVINLMEI
jgi:hypothetical protein